MKKAIIGGAVALAIGTLAGAGSASAAPSSEMHIWLSKAGCSRDYGRTGPWSGTDNPGVTIDDMKRLCDSFQGKMTVDVYRTPILTDPR